LNMQYVGGKSRIAKHITPIIIKSNPNCVIEPFCGALNISCELVKNNPRIKVYASDIDSDLIEMWQAVKDGWLPPDNISEEEYNLLKHGEGSPLRTFVGYGCSFGGKWFGGYARCWSPERNYCLESKNGIIKKIPYLNRIVLSSVSYDKIKITQENAVIYCDPPYINKLRPGKRNVFDHEKFWEWIKQQTVPVYVSEYVAPDFMIEVWSKIVKTNMNTKNGKDIRTEKLFWNGPPKCDYSQYDDGDEIEIMSLEDAF